MKKVKYIDCFLAVSVINTVFFFCVNYIKKGVYAKQVFLSWQNQFSDYFWQISLMVDRQNVYNTGAPFPPFAYLMYYFLWMLNPIRELDFIDWEGFKNFENNLTFFLLYNVVQIILLVYVIRKVLDFETEEKRMFFSISICLSYPILATSLQRGNSVFLTTIILIMAWHLIDKSESLKKELGLFLISIAAGIKMYPALCGIYFIKKREKRTTIRLLLYGLLIFLIPFIFFGGTDALKKLIENYIHRMGTSEPHLCTFKGLAYFIFNQYLGAKDETALLYAGIFSNLMLFLLLFFFFITKLKWKEILFLAGIFSAYIPTGWMYTSVYMLIPLLFFLKSHNGYIDKQFINIIYCVLFGIIFSICQPLLYNPIYGIHGGVFLAITLLLIIAMAESFYKELWPRFSKDPSSLF